MTDKSNIKIAVSIDIINQRRLPMNEIIFRLHRKADNLCPAVHIDGMDKSIGSHKNDFNAAVPVKVGRYRTGKTAEGVPTGGLLLFVVYGNRPALF